jgi:cellulose biosynthesis protein BcsQ
MATIDDLDHICVKAGIDRTAYQSFPLALQSKAAHTRQRSRLVESGKQIPGTPTTKAPAESPVRHDQVPVRGRHEHRSPVLSGLLARGHDEMAEGQPAVHTISVIGAAGGVGTTTIAATVARIFSRGGRRVLLLDGASESLLPLYLGAGQTASGCSGSWSFVPHPESRHGAISVFACGGGTEADGERLPWHRAGDFAGLADDIIVDAAPHFITDKLPSATNNTTCIVVLSPDIRCALQVRNIERTFSRHGSGTLPYYLLNRYDAAIPLHQEVRESLTNHLGDRLVPFTVRCSNEVPQALSEGLTVVDSAPDCSVAHDVVQLADWLKQMGIEAGLA